MRTRRVGVVCFAMILLMVPHATAADRDSPLIEASKRADASSVEALIAAGADVNARAGDGATALHWAAYQDNPAVVEGLLRRGADVNAATDLGITPLWIAADNSSAAMVSRLLEAGADPNIAPSTDGTPLMIAARRGNAEAIRALLARGADPNRREASRGQTALMWAAAEHHPEAVRLLLAAHADVKARSNSSLQRVLLCCQHYQGDAKGAAVVKKGGFTPLFFAVQAGDLESTKLLLAAGAALDDTSSDGASALVIATHAGRGEVAAFLLKAGADPNAVGAGYSALHIAATQGDVALVQALIAHKADLNARQQNGSPTKQIRSGHALDHNLNGATPFIVAACSGQLDVMRMLAAHGANTSTSLEDGRTVIMAVAGRGTQTLEGPLITEVRAAEVIKLAVELGASVNQAGPNGDTALHVAATRRRDMLVQTLFDNGAVLDTRNRDGETPLTAALKPPTQRKGSGVSDDYEYLLKHLSTAALLRKLGGKT